MYFPLTRSGRVGNSICTSASLCPPKPPAPLHLVKQALFPSDFLLRSHSGHSIRQKPRESSSTPFLKTACETSAPAHPEHQSTRERVPKSPHPSFSRNHRVTLRYFPVCPQIPPSRSDASPSFISPHHPPALPNAPHYVQCTSSFQMVRRFSVDLFGTCRNLNFSLQVSVSHSRHPNPPLSIPIGPRPPKISPPSDEC